MYIAVDDTDSRKGMCTTFLATEFIKEFEGYHLLDYPRLVRLNPNVPWKTRGNGAVVLNLGKEVKRKGVKRKEVEHKEVKREEVKRNNPIGSKGKDINIHHKDPTTSDDISKEILYRAEKVIEDWADLENDRTDPGLIVSHEKTPEYLYDKAVKDIVELEEVIEILEDQDLMYTGFGKKRGLIGAAAALAWVPKDYTYELITYRDRARWGTKRDIDKLKVKHIDEKIKSSFDSFDYEEETSVIDPNSPCPVLYGIRGDEVDQLKKAFDLNLVSSEKPERWIIFLTNQGTDDHIQIQNIEDVRPWISVEIKGTVTKKPRTIKGGHVLFEISNDDGSSITAAAYEPTKNFRNMVKKLISGDMVKLYGGIRKDPLTLNIEKMRILHLEDKVVKTGNPICPECNKRMSSIGKDAGFRCKKCSTRASEEDIETEKVERELEEKWYETPVSARRHLSKPLKRMFKEEGEV